MKIDNNIIKKITQNIKDFNFYLSEIDDDNLVRVNKERSEIRDSLGFDLYLLYYNLSESLISEDYEKSSKIRDNITNHCEFLNS